MSIGRLYSWGANSHGQLGLGLQSEQSTSPQLVDLSSIFLNPLDIKKITGGAGHTLILDKKGHVYSCGWNNKFQASGSSNSEKINDIILNFQKINVDRLENEKIKDVACGWDSSMALTENGKVFAWGSNSFGQLGKNNINKTTNFYEIFNVSDNIIGLHEKIKAISMGLRHSALVTESGRIFVSGSGTKGQLGLVDDENKIVRNLSSFTEVPGLKDVVDVSCGQNHTIAHGKHGKIYSWGENKHGQLGIIIDEGNKKIDAHEVKIVEGRGEILELRTGWTHTCVLRDDGNVYAWGRNTYGQLGRREEEERQCWKSKGVEFGMRIRQLAVGSEHNIALSENGTIFTWGWNEHGNCGNGSATDVLVPEILKVSPGTRGTLVGCGAGHSFAVVSENH